MTQLEQVTTLLNSITSVDQSKEATYQQTSQGLIVQSYCNSVLQQPNVDFSGQPKLKIYQDQINDGLGLAKEHSKNYLNNIAPNIIFTLTNLDNYYTLISGIPTALPDGATKEEWTKILFEIMKASTGYRDASALVVAQLQGLNTDLGIDAANFAQIVKDLNTFMNGNNGVLDSLTQQLKEVDAGIAGAITGIVFGSIGVGLGVFMILVGSVATFVTAGTSAELVIGGVGTLVAGVGGIAGSAIVLNSMYNKKADILREKSTLASEVNFAMGASGAYSQLKDQVATAMQATVQMQNAWNTIVSDLDSLIKDINQGIITDLDYLRELFLNAAQSDYNKIIGDIRIIKKQMAGVESKTAPKEETIGEFLLKTANMN